MNCSTEIAVRDAIVAILDYHEGNRIDNGLVCKMGRFHNILYVAVRLCYVWQLKDTDTVISLLEAIYKCENTFERIFIGAIFGNKAPHYIAGWKSDFNSQEENIKAVVFFINHAVKGKLKIYLNSSEQVKYLDVPLECCGKASPVTVSLQLGLPDKVSIFLRFGAEITLDIIEYILKRLMEFCHVYPYNLVACLQLILRVIPAIALPKATIFEYYSDLVSDGLIPLTRCGVCVPELKHLSRCTIREHLGNNYQLPSGIQKLLIPDVLKKYIDILVD